MRLIYIINSIIHISHMIIYKLFEKKVVEYELDALIIRDYTTKAYSCAPQYLASYYIWTR